MANDRYAAYKLTDDGVWCVWDHHHNQTVLESDGWLETAMMPDRDLATSDPEKWARQAAEFWNGYTATAAPPPECVGWPPGEGNTGGDP
jgi:hypothetical protein